MEMKEGKVRERQVPLYMGMIRENLEQTEKSLSVLRDSLGLVLKDQLPTVSENSTEEENLVPFACDLRDFHQRMEIIVDTINYMNKALEL